LQYGKKVAGGVEHVPRGWDEWHGLVRLLEVPLLSVAETL